jgi:hypothetical protein
LTETNRTSDDNLAIVKNATNAKRVLGFILRAIRNFVVEWAKALCPMAIGRCAHVCCDKAKNLRERVPDFIRLFCHEASVLWKFNSVKIFRCRYCNERMQFAFIKEVLCLAEELRATGRENDALPHDLCRSFAQFHWVLTVMRMRIFSGTSSGQLSAPAVVPGTHWRRWVIIHATLQVRNAAFCEFLCGGSGVAFAAEQSVSFHHSRSRIG